MKPIRTYTVLPALPATEQVSRLTADSMVRARALAAWRARVQLAGLAPDDVTVELYVGRVDPDGELAEAEPAAMQVAGPDGDGRYTFETVAEIARRSGLGGYTIRVLPAHPDLVTRFVPGLITWAAAEAAQAGS